MNWTTWIEVNLDALAHNLKEIQAQTNAHVCVVVKGDAYGHGAPVVVHWLQRQGTRLFAVSDVEEALAIRSVSQAPLLLLGPPLVEQLPLVVKKRLIPTIMDFHLIEPLERLASLSGIKQPVHLKVDTGLGRLGVTPENALALAMRIARSPSLILEGVFTHFADGADRGQTGRQLRVFLSLKALFAEAGITSPIWHAANSPAFCLGHHTHLDMVRIGTLLYGQGYSGTTMSLKETWSLLTRVIAVKEVRAGSKIGYGGTYRAKKDMVVGVIPVGYSDGLDIEPRSTVGVQIRRTLTRIIRPTISPAYVGDFRVPIVGKVGMNLTCIDLSGLDEVELGMIVRLEARRTTINRRLPKVYVHDEKPHFLWWNNRLHRASSSAPLTNQGTFDRTNGSLYDQVSSLEEDCHGS